MAKILLVEDDNNLREIYEARLQAEGYDIVSASDGEDALAVAKVEKPELVISDVMMPKISGFEMLDILRNTEGLADVKVIMLTALGQAEDKTRADQLGADRYLVKSQVTLEDIVKTAHQLLDDEVNEVAAPSIPTAPAAPFTPAPEPIVSEQADIAVSAAANAVTEPAVASQVAVNNSAETTADEKAAMDEQINTFEQQPAAVPATDSIAEPAVATPPSSEVNQEPVALETAAPAETVTPISAPDPVVAAPVTTEPVAAESSTAAAASAPAASSDVVAPVTPPITTSDAAASTSDPVSAAIPTTPAVEPVTPVAAAAPITDAAANDQILADAVKSLGGEVENTDSIRPSEVTAVEVQPDPTVGVPAAPGSSAAAPAAVNPITGSSSGGGYLSAPAAGDTTSPEGAADPVAPVTPPPTPASAATADTAPRKKVIQPLNDTGVKPDINALLAAEEAKSPDVISSTPIVNGQATTPAAAPVITPVVADSEPSITTPPAQSLTEQPTPNPALQMSPELQASVVEPPSEDGTPAEPVAASPAVPVEPSAPETVTPAPETEVAPANVVNTAKPSAPSDPADPSNIAL